MWTWQKSQSGMAAPYGRMVAVAQGQRGYFTSKTGTVACDTAPCATEPNNAPAWPPIPRVPMTIMSQSRVLASSAIVNPGSPMRCSS